MSQKRAKTLQAELIEAGQEIAQLKRTNKKFLRQRDEARVEMRRATGLLLHMEMEVRTLQTVAKKATKTAQDWQHIHNEQLAYFKHIIAAGRKCWLRKFCPLRIEFVAWGKTLEESSDEA